ncbi:sugar-binding domain-containing protein [Mucilaginibacter sp. BT774]|uniref:sugar-binding domain-containing protein n=1 Tax=Mucilaginibacter sp. BT774 TaxID=3062276 RepID=UPI002675AD18|nr:sugar-binding domain-containing protein [Mucilaginibacter sp. BT774]MDO3626210.1 glycoside hydrolase family 2 TIM barrel-domain containing protein [Mucilaginibacter sp. BT774]
MESKHQLILILMASLLTFFSSHADAGQGVNTVDTIRLSGKWRFQTDPADVGVKQKWYKKQLKGTISLPGSMTSNHLGDEITVNTPWTGGIEDSSWFHKPEYARYRKTGNIKVPFWLQPEKYYKGVAWYQTVINIPGNWRGKAVELFIERAHWTTGAYIDDKFIGTENSLGTPHDYLLLNGMAPGHHTLSVRVDNRMGEINVGKNSHSVSDHTQGNWNGMVGQIYMTAKPRSFLKDIQLYPDIDKKQVLVRIVLEQDPRTAKQTKLTVQATSAQSSMSLPAISKTNTSKKSSDTISITYPMGSHPELWSEHHPGLYVMRVSVVSGAMRDVRKISFGMRKFSAAGTQFLINGHPTMLRGTLDCAAFPLTGYPPTDEASWLRILKTCKAFGLNHIRFHSWCPPQAAFTVADKLGLYFQIECSSWANQGAVIGDGEPLDKYIYEESNKIVEAFGNHPSFCLMDYGNEPAGEHMTEYLTRFVKYWQAKDPRRLYTTGSGWPIIADADYNSTPDPRIQHWGEGVNSILNGKKPSTDYDWSAIISKWQHPTVSHEIGQWCVYPDFKEISKYKGVFKAHNFEIFRDRLAENGLGAYEGRFLDASGKLQALCYKADIEAALRTKGFGGFQLLGLEDFPGQGTALVGVLNAFYQPKSYITAGIYNRFCNDVVPLARFPKMVYMNNESLDLPVEIAQFSEHILKDVAPNWTITDETGKSIYSGTFDKRDIPEGNGIPLGTVKTDLNGIKHASELTLTVKVGNYTNDWRFFVYPEHVKEANDPVIVTDRLSDAVIASLNQGGKVLLTFKKGTLKDEFGGTVAIGFSSIFWNTAWTHGQAPETLGILCDPHHPALKYFPTRGYSEYQWWDAMTHSSPIMLDSVAKGLNPVVRVIDDWVKARSLSLLFECRVGKGKLMVSGIDLLTDVAGRPEARQLAYSIENYMKSDEFNPKTQVDLSRIIALYKSN